MSGGAGGDSSLQVINAITQFVNGTEANWNSVTVPVPAGLAVYATDTTAIKIGDGVTLYENLPTLFLLSSLTTLTASINAISASNATALANCATLTSEYATLLADITTLQNQVAILDGTSYVAQFNTLTGEINTLTTDYNAIEIAVNALQSSVANLTTTVSPFAGDITTLTTDYNTLQTSVNSLLASVASLTGIVSPIPVQITNINNLINSGIPLYNSAYQTSVGGYSNTAIIASVAYPGLLWRSLVNHNSTNPDTGGANWTSLTKGRLINRQVLSGITGTYESTPGTGFIVVKAVGGGGGAGGTSACGANGNALGGGGQAGNCAVVEIIEGFTGGIPYSIGLGGGGGQAGNNPATNGGPTIFGTFLTLPGGAGGYGGPAINVTGTGEGANFAPASVQNSANTITGASFIEINSIGAVGNPGIASSFQIQGGQGGSSIFGNQPPGGINAANGEGNQAIAGKYPGCGATGGSNNTNTAGNPIAGADGANGQIIVEEYSW